MTNDAIPRPRTREALDRFTDELEAGQHGESPKKGRKTQLPQAQPVHETQTIGRTPGLAIDRDDDSGNAPSTGVTAGETAFSPLGREHSAESTKLTEDDVKQFKDCQTEKEEITWIDRASEHLDYPRLRELHAQGMTQRQIAAEIGRAQSWVSVNLKKALAAQPGTTLALSEDHDDQEEGLDQEGPKEG